MYNEIPKKFMLDTSRGLVASVPQVSAVLAAKGWTHTISGRGFQCSCLSVYMMYRSIVNIMMREKEIRVRYRKQECDQP